MMGGCTAALVVELVGLVIWACCRCLLRHEVAVILTIFVGAQLAAFMFATITWAATHTAWAELGLAGIIVIICWAAAVWYTNCLVAAMTAATAGY